MKQRNLTKKFHDQENYFNYISYHDQQNSVSFEIKFILKINKEQYKSSLLISDQLNYIYNIRQKADSEKN